MLVRPYVSTMVGYDVIIEVTPHRTLRYLAALIVEEIPLEHGSISLFPGKRPALCGYTLICVKRSGPSVPKPMVVSRLRKLTSIPIFLFILLIHLSFLGSLPPPLPLIDNICLRHLDASVARLRCHMMCQRTQFAISTTQRPQVLFVQGRTSCCRCNRIPHNLPHRRLRQSSNAFVKWFVFRTTFCSASHGTSLRFAFATHLFGKLKPRFTKIVLAMDSTFFNINIRRISYT